MADHTTEKFLNLLVVFSSAMALLLVYDRMDSMLTPYTALEPTVSVSELSQKCSSIWKGHRQNATQQNGKHVDRWFSNHHTKPKYTSSGFCERLPANLSAPHLWNEHLHWILEASSNVQDISSHLLTSKLLQFLTPSKYLELGHRSRPSHQAWGRLLDKIHKRMKDSTAPVVHIAAFGAGSIDCNLNEPGQELSADERRKDMDCLWPIRLEAFLNTILNHGGKGKRAIVNITPLYTPKDGIMVTTELDTAVVRNQLWVDYIQKSGGPDVIISAFNAQDMYLPRRDMDTANDIDYYHHQRTILQDFYRTCLELKPCQSSASRRPDAPLLLAVDDYVGNQHGPVMAETVQARVLQLLSDYYETGFVSYAEVIRKLVYASNHNHSPLIHTSLKEWASDWHSLGATSDNSNNLEMMEHGFLGPIAMTLTLAYSFLRYTVGFCEEQQQQQAADYAMVKEDVFHLVQDVIPPTLDTDLCLNNVTELWAAEKTKQEERNQACLANPGTGMYNCAFDFWGGTHDTSEMLEEYLQNFMNHGDVPEGWQTAHGGRLLAMQAGATLALQMKPLPGRTHWKLQVFSVYKDVAAESEPAVLQWTVSPTGQRRHRRLIPHHKHNNNYTIEQQSRRSLQEHSQTTTGRINGTHDSPSTVVLPTILPIDESLLTSEFNEFELKLELIEGNSFEIVAIMFCSEDQYNI